MHEKVCGIILSVIPYKDTSKILNIFTKEYGLIGVIAKGAKNPKSPLRAVTENYTYGYFYIYYKLDRLSILSQVDIINPFLNIRTNLELTSYRSFICELTHQTLKESPEAEIFDYLINGLEKMNQGLDPMIITNILELKYLDYLGTHVNLDSCIKCGSTKDILTIDGDAGGYICKNCYTNEIRVNPKTLKMIRMYYYINIKSISSIKVSNEVKNDINQFLTIYYEKYTGLYLKSKDFLNKIIFN